jgi:nucleotide-binding universal stress UspA family protein
MSATGALTVLILSWVVIGVAAAIVMGRRGHAPYSWALMGAVLGPLVVPLMISATRRERTSPTAASRHPDVARTDPARDGLDLLVGIDGSDQSMGALRRAIELFGPFATRVTIATVLDYDAGLANAPRGEQERAREILASAARLAAGLLGREPDTVVLTGRPDEALVRHAQEGDALLVVAPRGKGASRVLFGSVASRLARGVDVPIAILPPAACVEDPR